MTTTTDSLMASNDCAYVVACRGPVGSAHPLPAPRTVSPHCRTHPLRLHTVGARDRAAPLHSCIPLTLLPAVVLCPCAAAAALSSLSFSHGTPSDQAAAVFAGVFVIVWLGSGVVTINAQLLGGNISFLQSVCVLGYCIAPLALASLVTHIVALSLVHWICVAVALVWCCKASVGFMSVLVPNEKRALAVYPVLLFYFSIAWLILVSSAQ